MRIRKTPLKRGDRIPLYLPLDLSDNALKLINDVKYANKLMIELLEDRAHKIYGERSNSEDGKTS